MFAPIPGSMFQMAPAFGQPGFNPGGLVPQLMPVMNRFSSVVPMAPPAQASAPQGANTTPTGNGLGGLGDMIKQLTTLGTGIGNLVGRGPTAGPLGNGNNGPGWGGLGGGLTNWLNGYSYDGTPGASVLNNLSAQALGNINTGAAGL